MAATLPLPIQYNSRRRHIQRFLILNKLSIVLLWFPIIKEIILRYVKAKKQLIIAIDRTQWGKNNLLMASVIIQQKSYAYILGITWVLMELVV